MQNAAVTASNDMPVDAVIVAEVELTPEQMQSIQDEAEALNQQRDEMLNGLAEAIQGKWIKASSDRRVKEEEWRKAIRLRLGNLSSYRGNTLTTEGSNAQRIRPDHNLVSEKCKIAEAQLISQQFSGGDKNWDIKPSPSPDVPSEVANPAAKALEKEIYDQLSATRYGPKARQAISDMVTLGTGILKGPVPSIKPKRIYETVQAEDGALVAIPSYSPRPVPEVYRVDPWMFFPDMSVSEMCDLEWAIEVHPMNKVQFAGLAKGDGFFVDVITELLTQGPEEYNAEYFNDVRAQTDSGENYLRNRFVVLEYHGPISVDQATALGLKPTYDSLGNSYMGEVWVCNGRVVRATLEAIEGAYELPYMAGVWAKDPNSPFGFGLPLEMEDAQRIHTSTLHMILDNASISSGPMIVMNKEYVEPVDGKWELTPHKIWNVTDSTLQDVSQAFKEYVPANVTANLMPLLQLAGQWAMEESGINLIAGGISSPQAGVDSATGLAILQQQATVVTDMKAEAWDDNVTQKLIDRMYHWNIQYNLKPEYAEFDFEVDVRSSTELRNKQMQVNNLEKLSVEAAQNPDMQDYINQDALLRARLSMMRLPEVGIVRSPEEVQQIQEQRAQEPQPPDPNMVKLQIEQGRVEMEQKRLEQEDRKLDMEHQIRAQQFEVEWQTRQEQVQARREDAQARIIQAEIEREIELLRLAQRDEETRAKIMAQLEINNMRDETSKFLEGMKMNDRAQDRLMASREMAFKAQHGSGI